MNFLKNAMLFILMAVPLQMNAIVPAKPIKILMVSGGCYHDYITQTRVLIDSLNKYIYNIDWQSLNTNESCDEIVPLMTSKDWGKGYDLIIYNICWATIVDTAYINNLCRIHHEHGINAIVLHCTMHTFRDAQADTWREFLGVETHVHAAAGKIFVRNVNPGHPVMKDFPAFWTTPVDDELYKIVRQFPNTVPLATGKGEDGKEYTCMWINTYGKAKVIGVTVGHPIETLQDHDYILFLARSVLWLNGKMDANGQPLPEYWKLSFVPEKPADVKKEPMIIEDFENYANTDSLKKYWNKAGWGNELSPSLETSVKGNGKKCIKCSYKTEAENIRNSAVLTINKTLDLSSYNTFTFWYKPDGSGRQLIIQLCALNDFGENVNDFFEAVSVADKMDTTGRIVSIPFSEFQRPANTNLAMKSLGFNKANVCQLSFIVRSSASQAGSGVYYLDDIKGVNMEK